MAVRRIVPNSPAAGAGAARACDAQLLGLRVVMDLGWVVTSAAEGLAAPQLSVAREGGSGTPVPDLSIEVDDLDAVHRRAAAGIPVEQGPVVEPWGGGAFTGAIRSAGR